jgi:hypothetical protein
MRPGRWRQVRDVPCSRPGPAVRGSRLLLAHQRSSRGQRPNAFVPFGRLRSVALPNWGVWPFPTAEVGGHTWRAASLTKSPCSHSTRRPDVVEQHTFHQKSGVGPIYTETVAKQLAGARGWDVRPDGSQWRRVVPSPEPTEIVELEDIRLLLDRGGHRDLRRRRRHPGRS